jgi:UDP-N-acetylmuramate--alanine ligase
MHKIKIGIIFGGNSREREVAFAGGRTVYDNLDKNIFEAIPIFMDSFGNLCLLDWKYIYKGSIRDFYPPASLIPKSKYGFQVYAESLGELDKKQQLELIRPLGKHLLFEDLPELIDFAFLALHGKNGEDGRLQGILEYLNIPYSGSGILPASIGMNKSVQKEWMEKAGYAVPKTYRITRKEWESRPNEAVIWEEAKKKTGLPMVIKSANQGSSIGVSVLRDADADLFKEYVNASFFSIGITGVEWMHLSAEEKFARLASLADFREGMGLPLHAAYKNESPTLFFHPDALYEFLEQTLLHEDDVVTLSSLETEHEVLIEEFIEGKEFSCIVIENIDGKPCALPPTEIRKGGEVFDYRSKYLPGLSRKVTPIPVDAEQLLAIRNACTALYDLFKFNVYARIDGFISDGKILLNDPNTTSGMMPSSFFFHQAAEIGLNPSAFLTYIISKSLECRLNTLSNTIKTKYLQEEFLNFLVNEKSSFRQKIRVAVVMGGYSSERHISIESGRNIYEKLASSEKYSPVPVFLTGSDENHELYRIPVNIMLKDNADDIAEKVKHYEVNPELKKIREEFSELTSLYGAPLEAPVALSYDDLKSIADIVFIALHGRPGEDGAIQRHLEQVGLPYNGSGIESSQLTINKFNTNNLLRKKKILVAKNYLLTREAYLADPFESLKSILAHLGTPIIAKPADEGCSTGVKKIKTLVDLQHYCEAAFRMHIALSTDEIQRLELKTNEEFPRMNTILFEELIQANGADLFMETTTGILTRIDENGKLKYEVFETSESLAGSGILSLEEKFLAGEGQNITPARFSDDPKLQKEISKKMRKEIEKTAKALNVEGYARVDNFVRVFFKPKLKVETVIIEVNSLPGMTPATCIFHQCALNGYKPYDFIDAILEYGRLRQIGSLN